LNIFSFNGYWIHLWIYFYLNSTYSYYWFCSQVYFKKKEFLIKSFIFFFYFSWNESWVAKGEDGSKKHYCGLIFFTATFYILSIVAVILLYVYYASSSSCHQNIFFITFNLIFCIIVSIVSVLPIVQNYNSTSGLLQSSFVTLYVIYLTWSAMSSEKTGRNLFWK